MDAARVLHVMTMSSRGHDGCARDGRDTLMKTRATVVVAGVAAAVIGISAGPAAAWDCIRVSGSQQGLQNSTRSGNWDYFTLDDLADGAPDGAPIDCVVNHWRADGYPEYFAVGIGVAGARGATQSGRISDEDFFVLARNAPVAITSDGHGVDHLDSVLNRYLSMCGAEETSGDH
jgi:hypothetical protein